MRSKLIALKIFKKVLYSINFSENLCVCFFLIEVKEQARIFVLHLHFLACYEVWWGSVRTPCKM